MDATRSPPFEGKKKRVNHATPLWHTTHRGNLSAHQKKTKKKVRLGGIGTCTMKMSVRWYVQDGICIKSSSLCWRTQGASERGILGWRCRRDANPNGGSINNIRVQWMVICASEWLFSCCEAKCNGMERISGILDPVLGFYATNTREGFFLRLLLD